MESRDGKCDPFGGVYSRVSFNLIALRNECIAFSKAVRANYMRGVTSSSPC